MDAVNGLKRLLTFGKRNGKASEAEAAVERAPRSVTPAPPATVGDDGSISGECPAGGSAKLTVDSSDDPDSSYVISPHGNSSTLSGRQAAFGLKQLWFLIPLVGFWLLQKQSQVQKPNNKGAKKHCA